MISVAERYVATCDTYTYTDTSTHTDTVHVKSKKKKKTSPIRCNGCDDVAGVTWRRRRRRHRRRAGRRSWRRWRRPRARRPRGGSCPLVVDGDLERLGAEAVGDGEHDAAHLVAELGAVDGAAVVGVELLEDGVVERGDLGGEQGRLGGAEPGAVEAEGLERAAELGAGQHAVAVGVQRLEARVDAAGEGVVVRHEAPHRRPVQDHHAHGDRSIDLLLLLLLADADVVVGVGGSDAYLLLAY